MLNRGMDHEQHCLALYIEGNRPADVPDGLVIVGATNCTLCKFTMRNNGYPSEVAGTPITWLNISEQDGLYKFYSIPGIRWSDEHECPMAGEHKLGATPIYLWVENGKVRGGPLAYGEQPAGGIAALIDKARTAS